MCRLISCLIILRCQYPSCFILLLWQYVELMEIVQMDRVYRIIVTHYAHHQMCVLRQWSVWAGCVLSTVPVMVSAEINGHVTNMADIALEIIWEMQAGTQLL